MSEWLFHLRHIDALEVAKPMKKSYPGISLLNPASPTRARSLLPTTSKQHASSTQQHFTQHSPGYTLIARSSFLSLPPPPHLVVLNTRTSGLACLNGSFTYRAYRYGPYGLCCIDALQVKAGLEKLKVCPGVPLLNPRSPTRAHSLLPSYHIKTACEQRAQQQHTQQHTAESPHLLTLTARSPPRSLLPAGPSTTSSFGNIKQKDKWLGLSQWQVKADLQKPKSLVWIFVDKPWKPHTLEQ